MKYFIDTEFIEGFHKPLFGKRRHFIDLISIGIIAEDARVYYAVSTDFNPNDANDWVKENVITKLPLKSKSFYDSPSQRQQGLLWKSNKHIAEDVLQFVLRPPYETKTIEFYGYYSDYDWVLFCSLFGRMIDLPKGFPMYCKDLKQMLDDKAEELIMQVEMKYPGETRFETSLRQLKAHPNYPKQKDEHNALSDATWNKQLYRFLTNPIPKQENLTNIATKT